MYTSYHLLEVLELDSSGFFCVQAGEQLRTAILSGSAFRNVQQLFQGILVMHANLKSHVFTYSFAFPFLKLAQAFQLVSCAPLPTALPHASAAIASLRSNGSPMLVKHLHGHNTEGTAHTLEVLPWTTLSGESGGAAEWPEGATVVSLDTCSHNGVLGWPLRNVCALLATYFPGKVVEVLALRMERGAISPAQSLLLEIQLPESAGAEHAAVAGWHSTELNQVRSAPWCGSMSAHLLWASHSCVFSVDISLYGDATLAKMGQEPKISFKMHHTARP
jgi:hypothetical protein